LSFKIHLAQTDASNIERAGKVYVVERFWTRDAFS
jgi:hypothetical protein